MFPLPVWLRKLLCIASDHSFVPILEELSEKAKRSIARGKVARVRLQCLCCDEIIWADWIPEDSHRLLRHQKMRENQSQLT